MVSDSGNRLGRVVKVVKGRAVVDIGTDRNPVLTPPLKWGVPYAGTMNSQRVPSVGEQVLLVCVGDKNDLSAFVIAAYFHCDAFPAPNQVEDQLTTKAEGYEATTTTQGAYNVNANVFTESVTSMTTTAKATITEKSKTHTIEASSITLKGVIALAGAVTATVTMAISKALSVAGIDFKGHKHPENNKTGGTTGGAQ